MRVGMLEARRLMSAVVAALAVAACSGGDDNGTEPTPTIDLALASATLSIVQGTSGTVNVTVTRGGGFAGAVTVDVDGEPTGVTVTPATIASGSTTGTLTIAAAGTAAPATTALTVRATGTGVTDKTAALSLTITAAPAQSYTLAVGSATATVAQGANTTQNITLTRTGGFAGAVGLAVEGLPTGVTGAFNPQSVTATSSVLTLTAAAGAATGTSTITVRGTATGQTDKTATFQLTVTAAATGSYTLAVTPTTVPVVQGATGTANVALTRTGGFTGAVALTVEGLPNGVTGAFNPASVTADASVLTLTAAAGAATGNATVTVKGTAAGQTDKTATFTLTVNAAGGYTMAVAPSPLPVQQGASNNATVTLTRTGGFAGAVALAATGLPNGVTAAFNPQSVTANTSTLTLTASPTATVGQATVTITGTATGIANQTATLTLNVTAATGGSGNTVWDFCTTTDTPVWFAMQDGTGAWTRVTGTGSRFQFNIASGRGGVAYVHAVTDAMISERRSAAKRMSAAIETTMMLRNKAVEIRASRRYAAQASRSMVDGFELSVFYGTQAEMNSQGTTQCLTGTGKTVNGTVAGVTAPQSAMISLGTSFASPPSGTTTFQLTDVPDGALDLVAARSSTNLTTFQTVVDKLIIRRNVNATAGSTLPVLDFNAAEAFAPATANISIGNLGGDAAIIATSFVTATTGVAGASLFSGFGLGAGPFTYYGVPTAQQAASDMHFAFVAATPASETATTGRFTGLFFKAPTDRTVTLGDNLPAQTISTAATTPYVRFRATGSITTAYNKFVEVTFSQSTAAVYRFVAIGATSGYLNNATTYDLTVPDFSGVAGWDNNWGPKTGVLTEWTVTAAGFSGIGIVSPTPVEGSTIQAAIRLGEITP